MATIAAHAVGTAWWLVRLRRIAEAHESTEAISFVTQLRTLCTTAVVLLSLHILEVIMWGIAYLLLVSGRALNTIEEAIYFSTVTFASLGYGDVVIEGPWRLLSAIQAMTGLLAFGWSSALLFAVVQRTWRTKN
ncbi:MAG TPA: two pore domain potassium channel family protein [Planctomycetaceae bacterium]|nr:two pore domain potassium channel family protein [Planctomycetaceae bacterium]